MHFTIILRIFVLLLKNLKYSQPKYLSHLNGLQLAQLPKIGQTDVPHLQLAQLPKIGQTDVPH